MKTRTLLLTCGVTSLVLASAALAQFGDPSKVTFKSTAVVGDISVIEGVNGFSGGNVAVSTGSDGVLLIDDAIAPLTAKLKAKLATISKKPVRLLINTHWHADHTGGNAVLGGAGTVIVAHDNARKKLIADQTIQMGSQTMKVPATAPAGLPVLTFADDVTLHFNGDDVHVFHVPPAHTDGDVIVHFTRANVIHTGDTFVNMGYPIADVSSGGKWSGLIAAADKILAMANDTTRIIPGHGPVGTRADVTAYRQLLIALRDKVNKAAEGGKSVEQVLAAKPLAEYDAKYGQGPMKGDMVVEMIMKSR
jgi:cyclase